MSFQLAKSDHTRANNFGLLRLLLAALVIFSHAPEMRYGNTDHEWLHQLTGSLTLGAVAVDGFFLVSGYLITQSFVNTQNSLAFFVKRACRIVPGYIVAFAVSVLIAVLIGDGLRASQGWSLWSQLPLILRLQKPEILGAFSSLPFDDVNRSMWTIAYEFRCYLAVLIIGIIVKYLPNRFPKTAVLAIVTGIGLAVGSSYFVYQVPAPLPQWLGYPVDTLRLFPIFAVGSLFYLLRTHFSLTTRGAIIALILMILGFLHHRTTEPGLAIFGGYLLFWFAFKVRIPRTIMSLGRDADKRSMDISYGLYLYAWPMSNVLLLLDKQMPVFLLCVVTLASAGLAGVISWNLIERPANAWGERLARDIKSTKTTSAAVTPTAIF